MQDVLRNDFEDNRIIEKIFSRRIKYIMEIVANHPFSGHKKFKIKLKLKISKKFKLKISTFLCHTICLFITSDIQLHLTYL